MQRSGEILSSENTEDKLPGFYVSLGCTELDLNACICGNLQRSLAKLDERLKFLYCILGRTLESSRCSRNYSIEYKILELQNTRML